MKKKKVKHFRKYFTFEIDIAMDITINTNLYWEILKEYNYYYDENNNDTLNLKKVNIVKTVISMDLNSIKEKHGIFYLLHIV